MRNLFRLSWAFSVFCSALSLGGKSHFRLEAPKERLSYADPNSIQQKWFDQDLDHFGNDESLSTWKQRYFESHQFEKENGPIFLFIGGEGTADVSWMSSGAWVSYAQEFGAVQFMLEHRYYGESHPTKDLSTENLKYLSSEQALADLNNFINKKNEELNLKGRKWITFGGSYPGSLSLWMRAKYPETIAGAISSSGPVLAKVDFWEYLGVVNKDFHVTNKGCAQAISEAMFQAKKYYKQGPSGWNKLSKIFNMCEKFNGKNILDVWSFFEGVIDPFFGAAQYNDQKTPTTNLAALCGTMTKKGSTPLERLAEVSKASSSSCLDFSYKSSIKDLENISNGNNDRNWIYQTCNEFGWYQTSNLTHHPFTNLFPVALSYQSCIDVYGRQFDKNHVDSAAKATNRHYGAKHPQGVSNVVIVHGTFDPWHAMGILKPLNPTVPVVVINGTSHCSNMMNPSPADPPGIKKARKIIRANLAKWLK